MLANIDTKLQQTRELLSSVTGDTRTGSVWDAFPVQMAALNSLWSHPEHKRVATIANTMTYTGVPAPAFDSPNFEAERAALELVVSLWTD